MTIRRAQPGRRNAPRPDSACHSADVMTAPERAAERRPAETPRQRPQRHPGLRWGDVEAISAILLSIRST